MLELELLQLYRVLRLLGYRKLFDSIREKSGSLSATEAFSADVIHLLGEPTLSQFADFLGVSLPNATYKVNSLVSKGYVQKSTSASDRREVRLTACGKFERYFDEQGERLSQAVTSLAERYTPQQLCLAAEILQDILQQLKPMEE